MHRTIALSVLATMFVLNGCRSHQAKVADLQKQYDQLGQQYRKDCFAEVTEMDPKPSPKCVNEKRQLDEAWSRLQAEQGKK